MEKWKPIPGYEGHYAVSSLGRVKSLAREIRWKDRASRIVPAKVLATALIGGYPTVSLTVNNTAAKRYVHDLVLRAFRGPPRNGQYARHYPDSTRTNCRLSNLRWGTPAQNCGDYLGKYLSDEDVQGIHAMSREGASQRVIATQFRIAQSYVSRLLNHLHRVQE